MKVKAYDRKLAESIAAALLAANSAVDQRHASQYVGKDKTLGTYGHIAAALENVIGENGIEYFHETGELPDMIPDVSLSVIEVKALREIYSNGLATMGGKNAADLQDDNMSWFDVIDLSKWLNTNINQSSNIMVSLSANGLAHDSGESVNNSKKEFDWYLSDIGIAICGEMFD